MQPKLPRNDAVTVHKRRYCSLDQQSYENSEPSAHNTIKPIRLISESHDKMNSSSYLFERWTGGKLRVLYFLLKITYYKNQ